jgi:RNA polymerase sigma factor (sigma-70 family)
MSTASLNELLEKLCQGDAAAAEQVFATYEPYLRQVVRRQLPVGLRAKFDSLDIVQSAWCDLLHGFRTGGWRFANATQLQAFLVKVTRNRFIDRCRTHATATAREQSLADLEPRRMPLSAQPGPDDEAQAEDLWRRMLALCPPEPHDLLRLKRAGVPLPEIARQVGLHVGSVRRILRTLALRLACESLPPGADESE